MYRINYTDIEYFKLNLITYIDDIILELYLYHNKHNFIVLLLHTTRR